MENLPTKQEIDSAKEYCADMRAFIFTAKGVIYDGDIAEMSDEQFRNELLK